LGECRGRGENCGEGGEEKSGAHAGTIPGAAAADKDDAPLESRRSEPRRLVWLGLPMTM
jgi:hypothetical protein